MLWHDTYFGLLKLASLSEGMKKGPLVHKGNCCSWIFRVKKIVDDYLEAIMLKLGFSRSC
jgi:hypothetical protein